MRRTEGYPNGLYTAECAYLLYFPGVDWQRVRVRSTLNGEKIRALRGCVRTAFGRSTWMDFAGM
jgi:hypothetical protein